MRVVAFFAVLILMTGVQPVRAAKITGKVAVTPAFVKALDEETKRTEEENRAYYWNEPNGIVPVLPPRVDPASDIGVVLFREGAAAPPADKLKTVKVHVGALEQQVVVTRPGSTIRFKNVDPVEHELYSPGMASFKPERQSNGSFRPIEFKEEGVYEVRCKLMPHFIGYVVVTKANIIVPVKQDGTFVVEDVEPGKYTAKVFHGGEWIDSKSFEVSGGGERLEIELEPPKKAKEEGKAQKPEDKGKNGEAK